jgi:hypothetical protein
MIYFSSSYVHFMTQLTIFFENVQMWREVRWSRVWGRKLLIFRMMKTK